MSNYFEVIGNGNNVIIDDTDYRLALKRVITLSADYLVRSHTDYQKGDSPYQSYAYQYQIAVNTGEKTCFVYNSDGSQSINCWTSGGYHTVNIITHMTSPVPSAVRVYIFGEADNIDPKFGLCLYNANKEVIFASDQQLLYSMHNYGYYYDWSSGTPVENINTGLSGEYAFNCPGFGWAMGGHGIHWRKKHGGPLDDTAWANHGNWNGSINGGMFAFSVKNVDGVLNLHRHFIVYSDPSKIDVDRINTIIGVYCLQTMGITLSAIDISRFPTSL